VVDGDEKMLEEKTVVTEKSNLFVASESELHYVKVAPDSEEYLKVWIKEPTWLQVEQAMNSVIKLDAKRQDVDLDLNAMYRYCVDNFIEKTEPSLSAVDLLRLTPYVGKQLKEILPNPLMGLQGDEEKNEESEMQ
jgi:hypothetical protein